VRKNGSLITQPRREEALVNRKDLATVLDGRYAAIRQRTELSDVAQLVLWFTTCSLLTSSGSDFQTNGISYFRALRQDPLLTTAQLLH
jgi:hypothetical protein